MGEERSNWDDFHCKLCRKFWTKKSHLLEHRIQKPIHVDGKNLSYMSIQT